MKLFLGLLFVFGGYYFALTSMADSAMSQLSGIQAQYSAASSTADSWAAGDTSADFVSAR
ncbi:hypothetical protein H7097_03195 [Aeromicrobium sp.]|nr:hypothetical protein [Candidatus Saccharibacteria bacterium]